MPIYEYECKSCGKKFEIFQKSTDKPSAQCPGCNAIAERIISQTSFTLKGGGWYKDGYSSKSEKGSSGKGCSCSGSCSHSKKSSDK